MKPLLIPTPTPTPMPPFARRCLVPMPALVALLGGVFAVAGFPPGARAQTPGSAFTYQGQLNDRGTPATGLYDLRFVLRDAATGGNQVPGTPVPTGLVGVTNGQFAIALDFGAGAFDGAPRWLEIGVRTNGSLLAHTTLTPRQPLTATPYATRAGAAASYTGSIQDSQLPATLARLNTTQTFTGTPAFSPASGPPFTVNNTNRVANLHADLLDGYSAAAFWNIAGNLGIAPTNFLGTLDNQPLQFRVNNAPALRLEPNPTSPNVVAGHAANHAAPGVAGAAIGGGGAPGASNTVAAPHGTIAGGRANRVLAAYGAIAGGESNVAANAHATLGGGLRNQATGPLATVGGGGTNLASGAGASIAGGSLNTASGLRTAIGGGANNVAADSYSAVAGGLLNVASGFGAAVLGGISNEATNAYATVLGGFDNVAGAFSSYAAGNTARALHDGTFVWSDTSDANPFASTGPDQFLIRAAGGVGIGTAPVDAALDVAGNIRVNDYDLFLGDGLDRNHGLGWYGTGKPFAGLSLDGPVLYGWAGGALGSSQGGARVALQWTAGGLVGIGRAPAARLHVSGDTAQTVAIVEGANANGTWLSLENTGGGRRWSFISTGPANGETAGQLLFFAGGAGGTKVTFRDSGHVGIGTTTPGDRLEVAGPDATVRVKNQNDTLGAFLGNTFSSVQLGLYNPSAGPIDAIPAGAKRSLFGFDRLGRVGSLVSNFGDPSFRNLLDDGAGNVSVNAGGALSFGATTRQMIHLWNANYGIGVQANTFYSRSDGNFAWYRGGVHAQNTYDPGGGGTVLMRLDSGGLTVNTTFISASDRQRKENFTAVHPRDVLSRLVALPIQEWNYKDDAGVRHIGPVAQDFHAAFGVGPDDRHIAMVDADGVALAAIQGLHELLREKDAALAELRQQHDALQKRLAALETAVARLERR